MTRNYTNCSKVYRTPRRPYEKERIDSELKLIGEYGLRNKKEIWRVQLTLSKIRASARMLLTLSNNDSRKLIQGESLLRRLKKFGIIEQNESTLDRILTLKLQDFLERRLQTIVFKVGLAKSIHHARVLILQRHIAIQNKLTTIPSFLVRLKFQKEILYFIKSPYSKGDPGRVRKKTLRQKL